MIASHNRLAKLSALLAALSLFLATMPLANADRGEYGFGVGPQKKNTTTENTSQNPPKTGGPLIRKPFTPEELAELNEYIKAHPEGGTYMGVTFPALKTIADNANSVNNSEPIDVDDIPNEENSTSTEERSSNSEGTTTTRQATTSTWKTLSEYQQLRRTIAGDKSPNLEELENLLKSGISPNAIKDEESGHTILHYAVWDDCRPEVVEMLLKYGADPNSTRKDGVPVLRLCFSKDRDNDALAELLCDYGANVNYETKDGSLLSAAQKLNKPKVGRVLRSYGGKFTKTYPTANLPAWKQIARLPQTKSPSAKKAEEKSEVDAPDDELANSLEVTLFDLNHSADGKTRAPTGLDQMSRDIRKLQLRTALKLLDKNWDVSELKNLYPSAPTKLYATNVLFVDMDGGYGIDSSNMTQAFADKNGNPPFASPGWLCYYEGWFSVPQSGVYRFVGMADDALIVGVNKRTVMFAFWPQEGYGPVVNYVPGWEPKNCCGANGNDGSALAGSNHTLAIDQLKAIYKGSWLKLTAGKRYRIQIGFLEANGGMAYARLGIQRQGRDSDNNFPLFTLEKADPNPQIKINTNGMYNTSSVFCPVRQ